MKHLRRRRFAGTNPGVQVPVVGVLACHRTRATGRGPSTQTTPYRSVQVARALEACGVPSGELGACADALAPCPALVERPGVVASRCLPAPGALPGRGRHPAPCSGAGHGGRHGPSGAHDRGPCTRQPAAGACGPLGPGKSPLVREVVSGRGRRRTRSTPRRPGRTAPVPRAGLVLGWARRRGAPAPALRGTGAERHHPGGPLARAGPRASYPARRPISGAAAGLMLWFWWNTLPGSYFALTAARRG